MRDKVIGYLMQSIEKQHDYSKDKLEEIQYGLEALYITITKTAVILVLAYFLGIFWIVLLLALLHGLIRTVSFGLHATSSWLCFLFSGALFIIPPLFFNLIILPLWIQIAICLLALCAVVLWAPADTKNRPLYNKKKRERLKILSIIITLVYITAVFLIDNNVIANAILYILIIKIFDISPFTYKLFKQPYANYKREEVK